MSWIRMGKKEGYQEEMMLGMGEPEKETPQGRDPGNPLCCSVKSLYHQRVAV